MDSRLQRVNGQRLTHLRRSEVPRVAQAIVDVIKGKAEVHAGVSHDITFVEFRSGAYKILVLGDDWRLILPFFRYSTASYSTVIPPANQPPLVLSPQPNRVMQPPPVNPDNGLKSFLDGIPFAQYSKIQKLLTVFASDDFDRAAAAVQSNETAPMSLNPPSRQTDGFYVDNGFYNRLVYVLQELFPVDFPTTY